MVNNKMIIGIIIMVGLCTVPCSYAQQYSQYQTAPTPDHSQGNGFQCSTSSTVELTCEIENVLKFFLPQFVTIGNQQDADLKQIIKNQGTEISNQAKEINLLEQLVNNHLIANQK